MTLLFLMRSPEYVTTPRIEHMPSVIQEIVKQKIAEFGIQSGPYVERLLSIGIRTYIRCFNNLTAQSKSPLVAQEAAIEAIERKLSDDRSLPVRFPVTPLHQAKCG